MVWPLRRTTSRFAAVGLRSLVAVTMVGGWGGAPSCDGESAPGDGGPCTEIYQATRCQVARLSCAASDACPPSWALAQTTTVCGAAQNEIKIGACGAKNEWKVSYGSPPLFVTCFYDATSGALEGILSSSDANEYCDSRASDLIYGVVPATCSVDPNELSYPCH